MTASAAQHRAVWEIPGWLTATLLVAGTALGGPALGSLPRPLFILACGLVAQIAWRQSAAAHLQAALILFAFSPLVRRLIDPSAGFDPSGIMLVGPLLALLVPGQILLRVIQPPSGSAPVTLGRIALPALIVAATVLYGALLSVMQNDISNAASGSVKWFAPLIYALALLVRGEQGLPQAAARAFLINLPVAGAYGAFQYVNPPAWDRFWMNYGSITSAGFPELTPSGCSAR